MYYCVSCVADRGWHFRPFNGVSPLMVGREWRPIDRDDVRAVVPSLPVMKTCLVGAEDSESRSPRRGKRR